MQNSRFKKIMIPRTKLKRMLSESTKTERKSLSKAPSTKNCNEFEAKDKKEIGVNPFDRIQNEKVSQISREKNIKENETLFKKDLTQNTVF